MYGLHRTQIHPNNNTKPHQPAPSLLNSQPPVPATGPTKSASHNAYNIICNIPCWYYFGRPKHSSFHNFCTQETPPKNLKMLMGLGEIFIPTPFFSTHNQTDSHTRLTRSLKLKTYFSCEEIENLECNPKIYVPSKWSPPDWLLPTELRYQTSRLIRALEPLFKKRRGTTNLLPTQRRLLHAIRNNISKIMVVQCDENLEPAIIDRLLYIQRVLSHLLDRLTYDQLTQDETINKVFCITVQIDEWIFQYKDKLSQMEVKLLAKNRREKLPIFYMTIKAHKSPWSLRPITACHHTILYGLGVLVDRWL